MPAKSLTRVEYYRTQVNTSNWTQDFGWLDSRSGFKNPSYMEQIRRNEDASTPYYRRESESPFFNGQLHSWRNEVPQPVFLTMDVFGDLLPGLQSLPADIPYASDVASNALKAKVQESLGSMASLASAYELRELPKLGRSMIDITIGMLQALLDIRHLKFSKVRKLVADIWLNWSFAISPLIGDASALAGSLAAFFEQPFRIERFTGGFSESNVESVESPWYSAGSMAAWDFKIIGTCNDTVGYKYGCAVKIDVTNECDYSLLKQLGLDFTFRNYLIGSWELIPYSWLADYFTTVGSCLSDTITVNSGNTIYIFFNRKFERSIDFHVETRDRNPNMNYGIDASSLQIPSVKNYSFQRTAIDSIPPAQLRFKTSKEVGANSVNRLLNLIALLQ